MRSSRLSNSSKMNWPIFCTESTQEGDIDAFLAVPARHARTCEDLPRDCYSSTDVFAVLRFLRK